MPQVKWRARATADVERLHNFLREKDKTAAQKMAYAISHGTLLLKSSPRIGRPMNDGTSRRELFIPFGSSAYIIRYLHLDDDTVLIVRVWHGREDR